MQDGGHRRRPERPGRPPRDEPGGSKLSKHVDPLKSARLRIISSRPILRLLEVSGNRYRQKSVGQEQSHTDTNSCTSLGRGIGFHQLLSQESCNME